MLLAQLELNEAAEVEFGIEIHGTTEKTSDIRFVIEGPDYGIQCKCREENGTITALIPKLKGILPAGQFEARLEVVLDGRYFMPLQESIEFKPLVEFDVTSAKARPQVEAKVNTTAVKVRVLENDKEDDKMKAEEFGGKDDDNEEVEKEEPQAEEAESKEDTPKSEASAKAPKTAKAEGVPEGDKPAQTWDQIVKKSITNPKNAPKIEKGDFDYDNVKGASPELKQATKSAGTDTATAGLPAQGKDTQKGSTPTAAPKKQVNKARANEILERLNGFKTKLSQLKGKK